MAKKSVKSIENEKIENATEQQQPATAPVMDATQPVNESAPAGDTKGDTKEDTTSAPAGDTKEDTKDNGEPKERKERAKMNPSALPVREIVEKALSPYLPIIKKELGEREDAEQLAKAQLLGAGYDIVNALVDCVQKKYIDYAKRSYMNCEHYQVWNNTRTVAQSEQAKFENDLAKLYAVTDENVYKMLESADVIVKQTAQDIISNFLPHYIISNASNLKEQLTAIKKADLPVVYITNELWKNNDDIADALQEIGYDYEKRESIPAREFFGISKKFGAVENLRLFVKL